jgi:hypothetical protein
LGVREDSVLRDVIRLTLPMVSSTRSAAPSALTGPPPMTPGAGGGVTRISVYFVNGSSSFS